MKKTTFAVSFAAVPTALAFILFGACTLLMSPDTDTPANTPQITALKLASSAKTVKIGGMEYIGLSVSPANLQQSASIAWEYNNEIISCQGDSYGVVISGLQAGQTSLVARSGNITGTCIITVDGVSESYASDPYIYSNYNVLELKPGITQKVNVSLYGGAVADAGSFSWSIDNPAIASIEPAGQYCHITANAEGAAQITVTHPKSAGGVYNILVYVFADTMTSTYITTTQNIVTLYQADGGKQLSADLKNPQSANYKSQFSWEILQDDGNPGPCVSVIANADKAVITPVKSGVSKLRVTHPESSYPLDITVRIIEIVQNVYIEPDTAVLTVSGSTQKTITVQLNGLQTPYSSDFIWTVEQPEYIDGVPFDNQFLVTGKKNGATKVTVSHPNAPYPREIMVLVRDQAESAINASMYITTTQNYIRTKAGIEGTELSVSLVGGEPGDEAGFVWTVDDPSVIRMSTTHGIIRSIFSSRTNGKAYIDALKEGTAVVSVTHPKIITPTEIIVKVLPKTALLSEPFYLLGDNIIGIVVNESQNVSVSLQGISVTPADAANIAWNVENPAVVSVSPSGNEAILTARSAGQTYVTVTHPNVENPKKILVYTANTPEELAAMKLLYTTKNYYIIAVGSKSTLYLNYLNFADNELSGISWTASDPSVVSSTIGINNTQCVVTGLKTGTATVTASHPAYGLAVAFSITVVPAGTYVSPDPENPAGNPGDTPSPAYITGDNIIALTSGQQKNTSVTIIGTGITPTDAASFSWSSENPSIVTVAASSGSALLKANAPGQTYISVSHPKADTPKRILLYVSSTKAETDAILNSTKLLYTTKTQYTVTAGSKATLLVNHTNLAVSEISGVSWSVSDPSVASYTIGVNNTQCVVTGLKTGVTTVTASHPACADTVNFTFTVLPTGAVIGGDSSSDPAAPAASTPYIISENIIGIVVGQQKNTSVALQGSGITPSDTGIIAWNSENSSVASVASSAESAVITAHAPGQTYIAVSHPKVSAPKKILVYTANTQAELDAMKLIYTTKNYHTIVAGSKDTLYLSHSNLANSELSGISWSASDPSIASFAIGSDNTQCVVTGLKTGVTTVTASHPACASPVTFNISVVSTASAPGVVPAPIYFTTSQNVVQFSDANKSQTISVTPVNLPASEQYLIDWSVLDTSICTVIPNGSKAVVTSKSPGVTQIRVSHQKAENVLSITVRVGSEYIFNNPVTPYISASSDILTMVKGGPDTLLQAVLVDSSEDTGFSFSIDQTGIASITSQFSSGKCFIKPLSAGQAELTIRHPNAPYDKKVVLVVANSQEELDGIKYLTTSQNVVTVADGSRKTVSVSVQNAPDPIISGYTWSSSNPSVAGVTSSGATASLSGNGIGSAVITVRQTSCPYPLEIIVMCVDPVTAAANPYITTNNSIYLLSVGSTWQSISALLVGGTATDIDDFIWSTPNTSIIQLYGQGGTAQVKAVAAGTAAITISHPKAAYNRTVRVICESAAATNCYISVPESIITMKPTDNEKKITASLINGAAEDKYNFTWFLDTYDVVDLNYSANAASIKPLSQGETTLHIAHPKAAYEQLIIIKVTEYTTFSFGAVNATITEGAVSFISMQIPATALQTHVEYSSNSDRVVTISGTKAVAQLTGVGEGTAIVTAKLVATNTNTVQASAEMLVYCKKAASTLTYITAGSTVYTLEKNITRTISASLAGPDVTPTDSNNLVWESSNASVIKLAGASQSGKVTGKQVYAQAVGAGECIVTITHDKSNSPLALYFIVPGSNEMSISLNKSYVSLETGSNTEIKASLSNATSADYASITWTLAKVDGNAIGTLLGSGQTVAVYATKAGLTNLRASLPNGKYAECEVLITAAKQFSFLSQSVRLQPGESKTVAFSVSPSDVDISFVTSNDSYFNYTWSLASKTVTVTGKQEGTASLNGVTNYGTKAALSVICTWDYDFSIGKSAVVAEPRPDPSVPDKFIIPYTVNPPNANIAVTLTNDALAAYVVDKTNKRIILTPKAEGTGSVIIAAKNPDDGDKEFGSKTCALNFKYNTVTLLPQITSRQGSFSKYDSGINLLTIGDGEILQLAFTVSEPNVNFQIESVVLDKQGNTVPLELSSTSSAAVYQIKHTDDTIVKDVLTVYDTSLIYGIHTLNINWQYYNGAEEKYFYSDLGNGLYLIHKTSGLGFDGLFIADRLAGTWSRIQSGYGGFGIVYANVYTPITSYSIGVPVLSKTPLQTPRRVSETEYRSNPHWYVPAHTWSENYVTQTLDEVWYHSDNDEVDTMHYVATDHRVNNSGSWPENPLNPPEEAATIDTSVKNTEPGGTLKVTLLHNGVREIHYVPLIIETRNCSRDQQ